MIVVLDGERSIEAERVVVHTDPAEGTLVEVTEKAVTLVNIDTYTFERTKDVLLFHLP